MFNIIKVNICVFILLILCLGHTSAGQIVDFQYAQYSQNDASSARLYDQLSIVPEELDLKTFELPDACNIFQKLKNSSKQSVNEVQKININDYLQNMKQKFLDLMTQSQKIAVIQSKLQHLNGLINKTVPQAPSEVDLKELQRLQAQLKKVSENVTERTIALQALLSSTNQQKGDSNRLQKQYKLEAIKDKLKYLKQLKINTENKKKELGQDLNYQDYFDRLNKEYDSQSQIIDNISTLITQKDRLSQLKFNASNLQSSIMALTLYIEDLQSCHKEQKNIRTGFKDHQKIKQLIIQLKRIKEKQTGQNKYCDGVVKKLTAQIKNLLKLYQIISSCASDLDEKKNSLKEKQDQLDLTKKRIKQLEDNSKYVDFADMHEKQRKVIQDLYSKTKNWKIQDYVHSPEKISQLIESSEQQKKILQEDVNSLKPTKPAQMASQIPQLIKQKKIFKFDYCKLYQKYQNLANKLWSQSYVFESESKLLNKLKNLYNQEWKRLAKYEEQFYYIKRQIQNEI